MIHEDIGLGAADIVHVEIFLFISCMILKQDI